MRVTNQMFFNSLQYNGRRSQADIYKINGQIASGQKIQYSHEDSGIYTDTMRLDYELTTLTQVQQTTNKAQTFARNTDTTMNQFTDRFREFRTKLVQAGNDGTGSSTSMQAIANDLQALKESMMLIANTSINGQYIFSGSDMRQKPIDAMGNYLGNNEQIKTVVGANVHMPYNLPGRDLFIGRDGEYNKIVKTNIRLTNKLDTQAPKPIKENNTIQEMVGDFNSDTVFYMQGRKPNGETFASRFNISANSKVSDLLEKIGEAYGNNTEHKLVDVAMNKDGQIIIKDLTNGSGTLDFHLVAATDKTATSGVGAAQVDDPSTLAGNTNIQFTSFINSDFFDKDGNATDTIDYDKIRFKKEGNQITGGVSQVIKESNLFATSNTKLSEVAGANLDGREFKLEGTNRLGTAFDVTINFNASGSTFTIGGTSYNIFDKNGNATPADEVTYQQLNDIIGMVTSSKLPTANTETDFRQAIKDSRYFVQAQIDYKGQITVRDKKESQSQIDISLYDNTNASTLFAGGGTDGSALSFAANNALMEDKPYIDVFKDLDQMIEAVRNMRQEADGNDINPRNPGVESALKRLDHIADHFNKRHTKIGTLSNGLQDAHERATLLSLNVKTIQSEIIDTDGVEAALKLKQSMLSYEAMLSATAKINSLSLVNYI